MTRQDIMKKASLNASTLRILLSVSLILVIAITSAGFSYAHQALSKYAQDIARKKVDATSSNNTISSLQKVERTLQENQQVIAKVDKLRADGAFPEFMIVDQIKAIAKRNHIKLSSYSFGSSGTDGASNEQSQPPTTTTEQPATPTAQSGGNTISLTVTIGSIPNYRNYLQFLYDIEQNVPKMRIKSVGISGAGSGGDTTGASNGSQSDSSQNGSSNGNLSADPIVIEMYTQ